ncbi:hypothetical protein AB0E75_03415 [Streptomyces griseoviridis]|jgi:hypothetical protein|uniref:Integral membrane protein n=3 Tax=Streptomyces TaxID=1883 RepID=A0ABT9LIV5_STRGD|nr:MULTISPECIES: hypothetical protein [Streptomyces]MDP9683639.1 hypothetical protein [Streptomyces griseoviridis]GGS24459.1 hypothetical protein GCM10010238_10730 [Streptomyces niveoruber]GGS93439.1 hypothetical protein GCM10010240_28500 [Streptomyces griseoviridis]GGU21919.1 hypothetical protein GCM10010259_10310 [Streptomyces daghestanicus]GHI31413.1 hypothetical protein Sdagh_31430 [Streptomyces daghestanicus]
MPDRSLRLLTLPQQSAQGREHSAAVLLRERPSSPPGAPGGRGTGDRAPEQDDNPFAPPPEGTPDRPWQPRRPSGGDGDGDGGPRGEGGGGHRPWGGQWSDRQPGRSPGGFGERPGGPGHGGGPEQPAGPGGPRWDPTDPAQRRARYALLSGMWALFFALFSWAYVALLLGALALYWGVSALRAKPRAAADPDTPAPEQPPGAGRPQTTAAVSGLVTASLGILLVAASFAAQLVYSDYYTCRSDALTHEAQQSCSRHLPEELRSVLGTEG